MQLFTTKCFLCVNGRRKEFKVKKDIKTNTTCTRKDAMFNQLVDILQKKGLLFEDNDITGWTFHMFVY